MVCASLRKQQDKHLHEQSPEHPDFGEHEAAPRPSLFRGVRQFVWNHLESVSCHFAEQLQPLSTKHSRVVTQQFSNKKTPQLADPRNGAVFEPTKSLPVKSILGSHFGVYAFLIGGGFFFTYSWSFFAYS